MTDQAPESPDRPDIPDAPELPSLPDEAADRASEALSIVADRLIDLLPESVDILGAVL